MLKIKDEFLNKYVSKQGQEFFLSEKLTQQEILFVQRMINPEYVEEVLEEKAYKPKSSHKSCKGSKELGTACNKPECKNCNNSEE